VVRIDSEHWIAERTDAIAAQVIRRHPSRRHAFPASRDRPFAVARMPGGLPQAIVAPVRQLDSKEDTMRTNHRTAPRLIAAAAALAALAAAIFLLNPPKTQAADLIENAGL
jgi:hypothetical protein